GWGTEDSQQLFAQGEMIEKFALERCGKSPATFDPAKLLWMNGEYVRKAPVAKIAELARRDFYPAAGLDEVSKEAFEGAIALEHEKIKLITDVPKLIDFLIFDEYEYRQEAVEKVLKAAGAKDILTDMTKRLEALNPFDTPGIESAIKTCAKD